MRGDRALVTVRAIEPEKGKVDVPGGFLEVGEHPVDGLKREAREELGVEAKSKGTRPCSRRTPTGPMGSGSSRWASGRV